ncbi:MAG: lactate utilization protein [Epulopiscium sp.]|jgi:L-lactate utilization protein LutB|nr:lactate utilization protein [Candidatus Epulonipiscium sp.]
MMSASTPKEKRTELLANSLVASLEKRNFEAYFCPTGKDAVQKVLELIPEDSLISWGGSQTIRELGVTKALHEGNYRVIDRDLGKNPQEVYELHRQGLLSDYYITSTNAISEDGILVNVDGNGNRVAALCFGPKNVIVMCGINKVAQNLDCAISRARSYAAPINSMRFMGNTPCATTGKCHDCTSSDCICAQVVLTRFCKPAKRIKVILIGEELGF